MKWLLLRGLAREQRHWGRFREGLALALGAEVHCLDLPGTGTEHVRKSPSSIRLIAEDVRKRWELLGNGEPWGLLAVSLGGMVAMEWCAAYPRDFASLVLVNTSASNLSVPWRRMSPRALALVMRALAERDPVERERRILGITTRLQIDPGLPAQWAGFMKERPISRWTVVRQIFAASRFRAPPLLRPRTLVVSGALDPFTDPGCPRRLAEHLRAPLSVHPKAGHDLATDDPEWLAGEVRRWVDAAA